MNAFFLRLLALALLLVSTGSAEESGHCACEGTSSLVRPVFSSAETATGCECPPHVAKSTEAVGVELPESEAMVGKFALPVTRGGERLVFELEPYNCRGENFRVVAAGENGDLVDVEVPPSCTYRGALKGDPDTTIVGVITDVGASMRVFCSDGECWEILPQAGESGYELRTVSARQQLTEMLYVVESGMISESLFGALALPRSVTVKQAEIGFDIDYPTWSRSDKTGFDRSDAAAVAKMEEFVAVKLNSFIISNALVEHVIGTVVIRKSTADDPYNGMTDSSAILSRMRSVWNGDTSFPRPSSTHDLAAALIGRGIGVSGLGYVGTINEGSRYNIGTTINGSGVGFWFNGIGKHECGHNWGLNHGGCGDEKRPGGDDFTWSMCGGYHERMRSDEASRVISERDSSNLQDIGAYTASDQAPYCPKDTATVSIAGDPVLLDVQRNDYDANNSLFQIEKLTVGTVEAATTDLGGTITISDGTGPGGRDQVSYTPPTTGTPGAVDKFYYTVRDDSGRSNFGQVKVTLQPSTKPKEVNPASYIADSAIDFSREQNPTLRLVSIDIDGNDVFGEVWSYGSFNNGSTTLTLATGEQSDSIEVVGDENDGWIGSDAVRIHKLSMLPTDNNDAVKRWNSHFTGEVAAHFDIRRVSTGGNGSGVSIRVNGVVVWSDTINDAEPHVAGTVFFEVVEGDKVDFVLDSLGSRSGDWTFFNSRIVEASQVKWRGVDAPEIHYRFDAAGTYPIERRSHAADRSGNQNHAPLVGFDVDLARAAAEIENGLTFDGSDDEIITPEPAALQGASELTISAWVNPSSLGENRGIVTSLNDADQNTSYFGLLVGPNSGGNAAQFRAHRGAVNGASGSLPIDRWTHLTGTWKAGEFQRLYVDGVMVDENTNPSSAPFDTDHWVTGRDREQANRWWHGGIDDVAIWGRALDSSEVVATYQQGRDSTNYDGSTDFEQSSSPLYANGSEEITMSAWVRADSLGDNRGIITSFNGEDFDGDSFERSYFALLIGASGDGRPAQFRAHRRLVNALPGSFPVGQWVHIVGVWRAGTEQSLYIDGARVAFDDSPVDKPIDIDAWITGRDRLIDNRFFDGDIGDHVILSRALDAGEVGELYAAGRTNYPATEGVFSHAGQIGSETGTFEEASGIFTSSTRGSNVGGTADSFMFASREHVGDGEIVIKLESLNDTGTGGKMGLMFREGRETDAAFVGLWQYNDGRVSVRYRSAAGATAITSVTLTEPATLPLWLRLGRLEDSFIPAFSTDGIDWQNLPVLELNLADALQVGLMHEANSTGRRSIASFSQFGLSNSVNLSADSDNDGLADLWEDEFFGNLDQQGGDDPDGDGVTNLFEYYHGTLPLSPDRGVIQPNLSNYTGELVPFGSTWLYLDDGSNQGAPWRGSNYDDSAWEMGAAPLGYNDGHIVTDVDFGGDASNRHITTYFRHHFFIEDLGALSAPTLSVIRDDGVAIFLNGRDHWRDNLVAGANFTTLADEAIGGGDETTPVMAPIDMSDLRQGWNLLSVEVHQAQPSSSDLGFDLELSAQLDPGLPVGPFLSVTFERSKSIGGTFVELVEASSDLTNWEVLGTPVVVISDNGETETVLITDDQPFSSEARRYLRLRLEVGE